MQQPEVAQQVCKIFEQVTCYNKYTNDILCWQIACGACDVFYNPAFYMIFEDSLSEIIGRPVVQDAISDSIKRECSDRFSLGAYALIFAQNQRMN